MSRIALAVLTLSAFVVLAGCGGGSGPGNGGNGSLQLSLTGGDPPRSGTYYLVLGETRPIVCTWRGGAVPGTPVWEIVSDNPRVYPEEGRFNAMALPPRTLSRNFLLAVEDDGEARWNEVRVNYGGKSAKLRFLVEPGKHWPKPGMTAPLNPAGARLKVTGDPSVWSTPAVYSGAFCTDQTGILELEAQIVGDYPGAPTPQWTADQSKLKFVGSSTGWTIRFEIVEYGDFWLLTAKIGEFAVTVNVGGNVY